MKREGEIVEFRIFEQTVMFKMAEFTLLFNKLCFNFDERLPDNNYKMCLEFAHDIFDIQQSTYCRIHGDNLMARVRRQQNLNLDNHSFVNSLDE